MSSFKELIDKSKNTQIPTKKKRFSFGKKAKKNENISTTKITEAEIPSSSHNILPTPATILKIEPISQIEPNKELISPPKIEMADGFTEIEIEDLNEQFQLLFNCLGDREVIGEALKNILTHINDNPNYRKILTPEHCGTMVQAMRETYGIAVDIKEKKTTKRAASAAIEDNIANGLGDLSKFAVKIGGD